MGVQRECLCVDVRYIFLLFVGQLRNEMFVIRLYISALTIIFMTLVIANRGLGILEAIIITSAIVYLIIDSRIDLKTLKNDLQLWQDLEKRISELLR